MMTPDQIIEVVTAFKEGKRIDFRHIGSNEWFPTEKPCWIFPDHDYRISPNQPKPKKWRKWTADEVPLGAQYRAIGETGCRQTILGMSPDGCITSSTLYHDDPPYLLEDLLHEYEYSTDNGKTWLPCGVEE